MRILVVGRFYTEGVALHIAETLSAMGHDVRRFDPDRLANANLPLGRFGRAGVAKLLETVMHLDIAQAIQERHLLDVAVDSGGAELTIVCHDYLSPRQVRALRVGTGAPVVLWFPDQLSVIGRAMFLNAAYDVLFFKDPYIVYVLREELGLNARDLPECYNAARLTAIALSPTDVATYGCDISTAGNMYPSRVAVFRHLTQYKVRIWGTEPSRWLDLGPVASMLQHRYVANEEKAKAFRAAKIALNNLHPAEIWGLNVRAFEICGAAAFQLVSYRPGLSQLFVDGSEVVSYRGLDDMLKKIEFYLPRSEERQRIAERGHERARGEHTYEHRLEMLLGAVRSGGDAFPMPSIA